VTPWVKWLILITALTFFAVFLLMPLITVFVEALRKGWETYWHRLVEPDAPRRLRLTLLARGDRCR
jgi:sulfate transport system permease protein